MFVINSFHLFFVRFNKLLNTVKVSLVNCGKAIDGLLVMSSDLEEVFNCVFDNKVPEIWHKVNRFQIY